MPSGSYVEQRFTAIHKMASGLKPASSSTTYQQYFPVVDYSVERALRSPIGFGAVNTLGDYEPSLALWSFISIRQISEKTLGIQDIMKDGVGLNYEASFLDLELSNR